MAITADSLFKAPPRISRADFKAIIERDAAPGVSAERDPGQYWDAIKATGVDPLFILAMFSHESTLGQFGMATRTFSWGNTRPPSFGVPQLGVINNFSSYRDWLDGCKSTASRLVADDWVYANRTSIRSIFDDPSGDVWAPAGDSNDPAGYLRAVLDYMNAHASADTPSDASYGPTSVPTPADIGNAVWVLWAADTGVRRAVDTIRWGVVHKSEGRKAGDIPTLTGHHPGDERSATAWVGYNGEVVWMVPLVLTAYTAGNTFVNEHSINFELEGGEDEPTTEPQYLSLSALFRFARKCGVPIPWEYVGKDERPGLIGHYDVGNPVPATDPDYCGPWGGRSCHRDPGPLFRWDHLVGLLNGTTPFPDAPATPTGPQIVLGFKGFVDALGDKALQVLGLPLAAEFGWVEGVNQRSAQKFERGWLVWHAEDAPPWHITLALLTDHPMLEVRLQNEQDTASG